MEELKKKSTTIENDKEIVFSKAIKAGKRIYYLDVKKKPEGRNVHCYHRKQESGFA